MIELRGYTIFSAGGAEPLNPIAIDFQAVKRLK